MTWYGEEEQVHGLNSLKPERIKLQNGTLC